MIANATFVLVLLAVIGDGLIRWREWKFIKASRPIIKEQTKLVDSIMTDFTTIRDNSKKMVAYMEDIIKHESAVPIDAMRIYAALLRKGEETMIHMLPAMDINSFIDISKQMLGKDWKADYIDYVDIKAPKERVVYRERSKTDSKLAGLREQLHFLMYTRDMIAEDGRQKDVMTEVVETFRKKYLPTV